MSNQFIRCLSILSFIEEKNKQGKHPSKEQIENLVKANFYESDESAYGKSTFHRDIDFIKLNFNDSLTATKTRPVKYHLEIFGTTANFLNDLNRNLVLLAAMKQQSEGEVEKKLGKSKLDNLTPKIILDQKHSTGSDYFREILNSCEKNELINFDYFNYDTQSKDNKTIKPYLLKEKKSKWYVLGFDIRKPENFRSYALERISNFKNSREKFKPVDVDFAAAYEDAFGMFTDGNAEKVVLRFDPRDGNYIKSNPMHHSQKVTATENGVEVELFIKPTLDFIMEIMSRSWSLQVIKPLTLKRKVRKIWTEAWERNQ